MAFDDLEEALDLANDSKYGLSASLFSHEEDSLRGAGRSIRRPARADAREQEPSNGKAENCWGVPAPERSVSNGG
jgi:hypothetical protein